MAMLFKLQPEMAFYYIIRLEHIRDVWNLH